MKKLQLLAFCFAVIPALAQEKATPATKSFESRWLKDEQYEMTWYAMKDTARVEIGKVQTHIRAEKENILVITQVSMRHTNAPWIDTTIAARNTLRPVYHASYNQQRDMVLHFDKVVTGYYLNKSDGRYSPVTDTVEGDYFDSNIYPVLTGWLPFKPGFTKDLVIYDYTPGQSGTRDVHIRNVSEGSYRSARAGTRSVWIVTAEDDLSKSSVTYHFDKQDRRLWKQEIQAGARRMMMIRSE